MASQSKSKAQRRAESQQRAAERRAAERRSKQMRTGLWVGAAVILVVVLVVVIVAVTGGGSGGVPSQFKNPHVALEPIPASMKASWVQPPAGSPGPETVPVPSGPKLASLLNAATGQTVDGVQCQAGEQLEVHVHTHLTVFVNGQARRHPLRDRHSRSPGRRDGPGPVRPDRQLFLLAARARLRRGDPH